MTASTAEQVADRRLAAEPFGDELAVARQAVTEASEVLAAGFRRQTRTRRKGAHDVETDLEREVEAAIMARLAASFPDDRRLGEETGSRGQGRSGRTWLVDPLDGTVNFVAGIPFFSVSVALALGESPMLGIVADPLRGEWFCGGPNGPWHEPSGELLGVRRLGRAADAVVSADPGDPHDDAARERIAAVSPQIRAVRTLGSIALSLAYLAAGRLDGVMQVVGLGAVDVAAGGLIASLAGARVTDSSGGPWLSVRRGPLRGIAAGVPRVHALLTAR